MLWQHRHNTIDRCLSISVFLLPETVGVAVLIAVWAPLTV